MRTYLIVDPDQPSKTYVAIKMKRYTYDEKTKVISTNNRDGMARLNFARQVKRGALVVQEFTGAPTAGGEVRTLTEEDVKSKATHKADVVRPGKSLADALHDEFKMLMSPDDDPNRHRFIFVSPEERKKEFERGYFVVPDGSGGWIIKGAEGAEVRDGKPNGFFVFVTMPGGTIRVSPYPNGKYAAHPQLCLMSLFVRYAGEVYFEDGRIRLWSNWTGTFRSPVELRHQAGFGDSAGNDFRPQGLSAEVSSLAGH